MVSRQASLAIVVTVVALGAVVAVLLSSPAVDPRPVAEPVGRASARLGSPDLDERVAGIHELEGLMRRYESPHQPAVMRELSAFVRNRTADCGRGGPPEDVEVALSVLRHRDPGRDGGTVMNLRGACLAGIVVTYTNLAHANLRDADLDGATVAGMALTGANLTGARLTGANLRQSDLVDADLTGADLDGADLSRVHWSDDTRWPPEYEQLVLAASSVDTSDYVIGELRLPDRK
ncbi:pentapeptide repeat-containing protein [Actinophytocola sp.]|uniref:pentapeptide repeat-containing protein n=1 Tax=Actinophytocola sp. TaxID=1872138 RepID=UPI00389B0250